MGVASSVFTLAAIGAAAHAHKLNRVRLLQSNFSKDDKESSQILNWVDRQRARLGIKVQT